MPRITTPDGIHLHVEEAGGGTPMLFIHEFGGDHAAGSRRCAIFAAATAASPTPRAAIRPRTCPERGSLFAGDRAVEDAIAVLDALEDRPRAHRRPVDGRLRHVHFGHRASRSARCRSRRRRRLRLREGHRGNISAVSRWRSPTNSRSRARGVRARPMRSAPAGCSSRTRTRAAGRNSPTRSPRIPTSARPTPCAACRRAGRLLRSEDGLKPMTVPTLVVVGDEDDHCLQPGIFLKKTIPACGLSVFPKTGHTLESGGAGGFNACWPSSSPRSRPGAGGRAIRARCQARSCARADPLRPVPALDTGPRPTLAGGSE